MDKNKQNVWSKWIFVLCVVAAVIVGGWGLYSEFQEYPPVNGPTQVEPVVGVAQNTSEKLDIGGPYGDNQICHPKLLDMKEEWNGYRYWMCYTPYPFAKDDKENPSIACSNDLVNWVTPNGLVNPLDDPEGKGYNSDPHIFYNTHTEMLECWFRYVDNTKEQQTVTIYRVKSKDGVHWTEKEEVLFAADRKESDWVSPCIIYEDSLYKMWFVAKRAVWYMESADLQNWSDPQTCTTPAEDDTIVWHMDIISTENGYEMLAANYEKTAREHNDMSLYYSCSSDGINWSTAYKVISPSQNGWDNGGMYRSTFIFQDGVYEIIYGAFSKDRNYGLGLTKMLKSV